MTRFTRMLEESYWRDQLSYNIRLHPDTYREHNLEPGTTIVVQTDSPVAVTAAETGPDDPEPRKAYIDPYLTKLADLPIGDEVTLEPVDAPDAEKLALVFEPGFPLTGISNREQRRIEHVLTQRPVYQSEETPIIDTNQGQGFTPMYPVSVEPGPIAVVTEETTIEVYTPAQW